MCDKFPWFYVNGFVSTSTTTRCFATDYPTAASASILCRLYISISTRIASEYLQFAIIPHTHTRTAHTHTLHLFLFLSKRFQCDTTNSTTRSLRYVYGSWIQLLLHCIRLPGNFPIRSNTPDRWHHMPCHDDDYDENTHHTHTRTHTHAHKVTFSQWLRNNPSDYFIVLAWNAVMNTKHTWEAFRISSE